MMSALLEWFAAGRKLLPELASISLPNCRISILSKDAISSRLLGGGDP
jgi:hypothetical protein